MPAQLVSYTHIEQNSGFGISEIYTRGPWCAQANDIVVYVFITSDDNANHSLGINAYGTTLVDTFTYTFAGKATVWRRDGGYLDPEERIEFESDTETDMVLWGFVVRGMNPWQIIEARSDHNYFQAPSTFDPNGLHIRVGADNQAESVDNVDNGIFLGTSWIDDYVNTSSAASIDRHSGDVKFYDGTTLKGMDLAISIFFQGDSSSGNPNVNDGGVWKEATTYANYYGTWYEAVVNVNDGGIWKPLYAPLPVRSTPTLVEANSWNGSWSGSAVVIPSTAQVGDYIFVIEWTNRGPDTPDFGWEIMGHAGPTNTNDIYMNVYTKEIETGDIGSTVYFYAFCAAAFTYRGLQEVSSGVPEVIMNTPKRALSALGSITLPRYMYSPSGDDIVLSVACSINGGNFSSTSGSTELITHTYIDGSNNDFNIWVTEMTSTGEEVQDIETLTLQTAVDDLCWVSLVIYGGLI